MPGSTWCFSLWFNQHRRITIASCTPLFMPLEDMGDRLLRPKTWRESCRLADHGFVPSPWGIPYCHCIMNFCRPYIHKLLISQQCSLVFNEQDSRADVFYHLLCFLGYYCICFCSLTDAFLLCSLFGGNSSTIPVSLNNSTEISKFKILCILYYWHILN